MRTIPSENGYIVNVMIDDLSESGLKEDSLSIFGIKLISNKK